MDSKVAILDIDTNQNLILTGDILHSMSLLKLENANFPTVTLIAEDKQSHSMTAVKLLKNDICLGADGNYNLIAMKQRYIAKKNEKPHASSILSVIGQYHLGELINKMQEGKNIKLKCVNINNYINVNKFINITYILKNQIIIIIIIINRIISR